MTFHVERGIIYELSPRGAGLEKKLKKTLKKVLTNSSGYDIIIKFAEKRQESQGKTKKLKKVLKKYLTNARKCDIINKLSVRQ